MRVVRNEIVQPNVGLARRPLTDPGVKSSQQAYIACRAFTSVRPKTGKGQFRSFATSVLRRASGSNWSVHIWSPIKLGG